jgi:Ca2+-binding RTX toxin-like protein
VHVSEALRTEVTQSMNVATSSLTRSAGTWAADGFYVGQQVWISGLAGPFTVSALAGAVMSLQNTALTPHSGVVLTVFGFDSTRDGGVRIGGDHITISGGAGPDSPLVVYGDTSQDGVWYSGHPYDVLGMEFGDKPFDPFPNLPDGENEDDEWVFPLANPYTYAGNDVIDASALFGGLAASQLPTVGLTIYGGRGDDTIIGSQAGDHLAGGSGNDTILGQRGVDHI